MMKSALVTLSCSGCLPVGRCHSLVRPVLYSSTISRKDVTCLPVGRDSPGRKVS